MTIHYESTAKKLPHEEVDIINYSDVHPHDPRKVIAFTAPAAAPHPSMRSRHRRMAQRAAWQRKFFVTYPRYASVALLVLFFYLRLAIFPEAGSANLSPLWIAAYALAAFSFLFARQTNSSTQKNILNKP